MFANNKPRTKGAIQDTNREPLQMKTFMRFVLPAFVAVLLVAQVTPASAEVKTRTITYSEGGVTLKGVLAWNDQATTPRPGVLVVHEWWGLDDYAISRAKQLAAEGYVAFAADMYGDNKLTKHAKDASGWMKQITSNVDAWRARADAGLKVLAAQKEVDGSKLAAIGYCFGGSTVMQMAYAGSPVKLVASFHGSLPPASDDVKAIKSRVYVAHGRADKFIPMDRVVAFKQRLDDTNANWRMDIFSGAVHGFTNPGADELGKLNNIPLKYDPSADRASWAAMHQMLAETFGGF